MSRFALPSLSAKPLIAHRSRLPYLASVSASRLLIVTGKGGVGKTTVTAALGWSLAAQGGRTLLVELAADRGLARLFGVA